MVSSNQQGFSLIEVMVTLVILAVLTAIAIPAYQGYIRTSRLTEGHNNLAAIQMAQEEFYLENNQYFDGDDWTELENNSGKLWTRTGSDGAFNFDYAVDVSGAGYVATATGTATGKIPGVVLTVSKN